MDTQIKTQNKLAFVKQFNCTNCGNALAIHNPRVKEIACQYCGSVLDTTSETYQILRKLAAPDRHPPFSFIRLGQIGQMGNKTYQVVARTRWKMKYKEYWREEGQSGYSDEIWVYDEWLLLTQYYTYFYLVEDRSGFWVSEEIVPETPMLLTDTLHMSFFKGQRQQRVQEYGKANVLFFEGESNYEIKVGDEIRFAMFKDRGINYSAEWRIADDDGKIKEIEFFKETPISKRRLVEAFESNEAIIKIRERQRFWRFIFNTACISLVFLLVLALYAFANSGSVIYEERFDLSANFAEGKTSTPIDITRTGLYRLQMEVSNLPNNSEVYILSYILNQDSAAINTVEEGFYYYSGTDSDGKWEEKDLKKSVNIKISQSGIYYLNVFKEDKPALNGQLRIAMYKGVWVSQYLLVGSLILLFVCILAFVRKNTY